MPAVSASAQEAAARDECVCVCGVAPAQVLIFAQTRRTEQLCQENGGKKSLAADRGLQQLQEGLLGVLLVPMQHMKDGRGLLQCRRPAGTVLHRQARVSAPQHVQLSWSTTAEAVQDTLTSVAEPSHAGTITSCPDLCGAHPRLCLCVLLRRPSQRAACLLPTHLELAHKVVRDVARLGVHQDAHLLLLCKSKVGYKADLDPAGQTEALNYDLKV